MSTPTSPKTPTPPTLPPGVTKTCHIVKRPDFDGYGFNLHSEKVKPGQYIGKVDADSPAEGAGLKEGDRILEVNGVSIGPAAACNGNGSAASQNGYEGTKQEMPGASANISSISMVSTKRSSNASSIQSGSTMNASDLDVVDRGIPSAAAAPVVATPPPPVQNGSKPSSPINNNTLMSTPPPPSATKAGINNNGSVYNTNTNGNGTNGTTTPTPTPITPPPAMGGNRAGSLNLPLTVAEMRAKLASKKKYDPKNESVDLKKKFDIIQKL
uniref:Protein P54 n=1 Tax=Drosophila rhopaloa TaxID=1041015 RepID=A0A6P4E6K9_DRORH